MDSANQSFSMDDLKRKAIRGALSLTFGQVIFLGLSLLVNNLILPIILTPSIIGTFNLATTIIAFFNFFSDIGLAASLIQKREITDEDLGTTFFLQELLVGAVAIIIILTAPFTARFYHLDIGGETLIRAMAVSFFLISFKSIPSALLERNLRFREIVLVQCVESVVRNAILLTLAVIGFGLYSFAFAEIASALIGVVMLYNISPWKVTFKYVGASAKELLHFGVPYQINQLLALFKDQAVDLVVAHMITTTELGLVTLAQGWAFIPLQIMNISIRVLFPAYSRMQNDREALGKAVEKSLYLTGLVLYPAIAGLLCLVSNLVVIIGPEKWGAVVPMVYFFSFSTFWASISTTYTNVFNAVGEVKLTMKLMIMWSVLEWTLTPLLVWQLGYIGIAIATAIISFSSIATILLMRDIATVRLVDSIGMPIICSIIMAVLLYPAAHIFLLTKLAVIPLIAYGGGVYVLALLALDRKRVLGQVQEVLHAIR